MTGALARHNPALDRLGQCVASRLPASFASLEIKQALDHPSGSRAQGRGALGQVQRRAPVTDAEGVIEQASKTEKLRLRAVEHRGEEFFGGQVVAAELGRLSGQQQGQWWIGKQRIGPSRATLRLLRIARRNGDHSSGQRTITGAPAALAPVAQKCARAVDDQRYQPKQQSRDQACEQRGGGEHTDRSPHPPALPYDVDPPGMIGKKDRRGDRPGDEKEAEEAANHDRVLAFSEGRSGAAPGLTGSLSNRAVSNSCRCSVAASAASRARAIRTQDCAASAFAPVSGSSAATASAKSPRASAVCAACTADSGRDSEASSMRRIVTRPRNRASVCAPQLEPPTGSPATGSCSARSASRRDRTARLATPFRAGSASGCATAARSEFPAS